MVVQHGGLLIVVLLRHGLVYEKTQYKDCDQNQFCHKFSPPFYYKVCRICEVKTLCQIENFEYLAILAHTCYIFREERTQSFVR